MELIRNDLGIDFFSKRRIAIGFSIILVVASMLSLAIKGPNYGIDFVGGALIQVKFKDKAPIADVREAVSALRFGDFSIQEYGAPEELLIRVPVSEDVKGSETQAQKVEKALRGKFGDRFSVERVEMVGPKVGADLRWKALMSVFYSLLGILIYLAVRFEFRFAVGAVVATMHDPLIIMGVFSVMGKEFTLTVLAAVLTIIGYSLNDTIVVFDRIRENLKLKRGMPLMEMLNFSINQTLSRTILTSGTTVIVVLALFLFGGEVIHDFALAILIGIVVGTFSSIYVASPIVYYWDVYVTKKGAGAPLNTGKKTSVKN